MTAKLRRYRGKKSQIQKCIEALAGRKGYSFHWQLVPKRFASDYNEVLDEKKMSSILGTLNDMVKCGLLKSQKGPGSAGVFVTLYDTVSEAIEIKTGKREKPPQPSLFDGKGLTTKKGCDECKRHVKQIASLKDEVGELESKIGELLREKVNYIAKYNSDKKKWAESVVRSVKEISTQNTNLNYIELLSGTRCACGAKKKSGDVVCLACFSKLPNKIKHKCHLVKKGEGESGDVESALKALGVVVTV